MCCLHQKGFKKLMWYGIEEEFNCKVTFTSTWSNLRQQFGEKGKEELHSLITSLGQGGSRTRLTSTKKFKCGAWDHYPINALIQEDEASKHFSARRGRNKWTGWKSKDDEARIPESCDEQERRESRRKLGNNTESY